MRPSSSLSSSTTDAAEDVALVEEPAEQRDTAVVLHESAGEEKKGQDRQDEGRGGHVGLLEVAERQVDVVAPSSAPGQLELLAALEAAQEADEDRRFDDAQQSQHRFP